MTLAATAVGLAPRSSRAAEGLVEVLVDAPIGEIAPEIHGHFVEHLGGVVYDGIWVGEHSTIPNVGGIRKDLFHTMQQLTAPVVRWPGGCFADSYNWRDGVGPRHKRPIRTDFLCNGPPLRSAPSGRQKSEPNTFGMCNVAQLVNCIHTPFLALEDHFAATPDFHAFDMYKSHKGSQSLRFVSDPPTISFGPNKSYWRLAGSASLRGKALVITVANSHVSEPRTAEDSLRGASARFCIVTVLASADIHAHNEFENPRAVEPERKPARITGSSFAWTLKPANQARD